MVEAGLVPGRRTSAWRQLPGPPPPWSQPKDVVSLLHPPSNTPPVPQGVLWAQLHSPFRVRAQEPDGLWVDTPRDAGKSAPQ